MPKVYFNVITYNSTQVFDPKSIGIDFFLFAKVAITFQLIASDSENQVSAENF